MIIRIVAPNPLSFTSGGNSYNIKLIKNLKLAGASPVLVEPRQISGSPSFEIVDSIYLNQYAPPANVISLCLVHHLESLYPFSTESFEKNERKLLEKFHALIVTSTYMVDLLTHYGFDHQRIICLEPVALKTPRLDTQPTTKLRGIMLSNIVERKGLREFLFELADRNIPPVYEINIIGSLEMDVAYARTCLDIVGNDKNLSRAVVFMGSQDSLTVQKTLGQSNVFISSSYMETFGMSIQEAALMGLHLLVLRGGNAENHVMEGVNGMAFSTMTALAKQVEYLAVSPSLLGSLLESTSKYELAYNIDGVATAKRLIQFLRSI